jgi:hypothetical protein
MEGQRAVMLAYKSGTKNRAMAGYTYSRRHTFETFFLGCGFSAKMEKFCMRYLRMLHASLPSW